MLLCQRETKGLKDRPSYQTDVLDKWKKKTLTTLLTDSKLEQAIVLATSQEAPPSIVPPSVKLLSLVEEIKQAEVL